MCRVVARKTLVDYWTSHPETKASLQRWFNITKAAKWKTMSEVRAAFSNAVVLNGERVRFEVHGGDYRLVVAFKFTASGAIAFVKFVGTHAEYDRVDALTISRPRVRKIKWTSAPSAMTPITGRPCSRLSGSGTRRRVRRRPILSPFSPSWLTRMRVSAGLSRRLTRSIFFTTRSMKWV